MDDEAHPEKTLVQRLTREGWAVVEEWLRDGEEESNQLEFKAKRDGSKAKLDKDDKGNIGVALSAFANTSGGLLVLGIERGKASGGPDFAASAQPLTSLAELEQRTTDTTRSLAEPPIAGLDFVRVEDPKQPNTGVLAIFVPRSLGGPHRVTNARDDVNEHYFMRTGSSSVVMPHPYLAALFGRAPQPELELHIAFVRGGVPGRIELRLLNTGRGAARSPEIMLIAPPQGEWHASNDSDLFKQDGWWVGLDGRMRLLLKPKQDFALYPGMDRVVGAFTMQTKIFSSSVIELPMRAVLYALDAQPVEGHGVLSIGDPEGRVVIRRE